MVEKRPLFSIILSAFNAERYLDRTVAKVTGQTCGDFELIIVNDGSTDRTGEIAARWEERDPRIRVLSLQKNGGLSHARNCGFEAACGRYIWYMDADDSIDENLLEQAARSIHSDPAQLILFGLVEEYYDQNGNLLSTHEIRPEGRVYRSSAEIHEEIIHYERETLLGYAWNKFYQLDYQREIGLIFEDVPLIEDIVFATAYVRDIDTMNVLSAAPYHYAKRVDNNLTNRFVPDYFRLHRRRIKTIYGLYQYWNCAGPSVQAELGSLYARYIVSAAERLYDPRAGAGIRERIRWCRSVFADPLFTELVMRARASNSRSLRAAIRILQRKSPALLLLMGRAVHLVRQRMLPLYNKVKQER